MSDVITVSGLYKCEITYLAPASISCPVMVTIARLVMVSPPSDVRLYHGASDVTNTSLGPVTEDSEVSLRCVAEGGRPAPDIYWYLGEQRLVSDAAVVVTRGDNVTGGPMVTAASVTLLASRDLLQASLRCKVANQAMEASAMTASVTLDISLRPLATR